ncbi:hypothetical protein OSTOST_25033 [Ostertagia ostertagi]
MATTSTSPYCVSLVSSLADSQHPVCCAYVLPGNFSSSQPLEALMRGYIFSAFNVGLLLMLITGFIADKFNAKYMIVASVSLAVIANLMIAQFSIVSVYFAIAGRFLVGFADALLQPAVNSLITRWFPTAERSYALGLATGGRQLGRKPLSYRRIHPQVALQIGMLASISVHVGEV